LLEEEEEEEEEGGRDGLADFGQVAWTDLCRVLLDFLGLFEKDWRERENVVTTAMSSYSMV
jgi:hypothetical protein